MPDDTVVSRELYDDAEAECGRLRQILRWCAGRIPAADLPTLQKMFDDAAVPDPTDDLESDIARAQTLVAQLAAQLTPVLTRKVPRGWDAATQALLDQARTFRPTNPLLRPTIQGVARNDQLH